MAFNKPKVGQRVKITAGTYRGHLGTVSRSGKTYEVDLDAGTKVRDLPWDYLRKI